MNLRFKKLNFNTIRPKISLNSPQYSFLCTMIALFLWFALSITFSFLCSVWEAVLLSITPNYVRTELSKGSKLGHTLEEFKEDIDKPLSGILTLNTIAHTVGAIGVGAQASALFADSNGLNLGFMQLNMESIIAIVMTLAILILSEIIPKTWGANNWRSLAPFTISSLRTLIWLLTPLIWLTSQITKRMKKDKSKSVLTRADFISQINVGTSAGAIAEDESAIITNVLALDKLKVQDIMTPRVVMHLKDESLTLKEYYDSAKGLRFSRIPVYQEREDNISGTVLKNDILKSIIDGEEQKTLSSLKRKTTLIGESKSLRALFQIFTAESEHIAVVTDQYGSVTGVVTMEDLVETILGLEIVDETDGVEDMQALAKKIRAERAKKLGLEA